jgi:hypothetical protein
MEAAWPEGQEGREGREGYSQPCAIIGIRSKTDEKTAKDPANQNKAVLVGFCNARVFERLSRDLRPRFYAPM